MRVMLIYNEINILKGELTWRQTDSTSNDAAADDPVTG